jgi:hypothetical protein
MASALEHGRYHFEFFLQIQQVRNLEISIYFSVQFTNQLTDFWGIQYI